MFRFILLSCSLLCALFSLKAQVYEDDFEGNGTVNTWQGDDCGMNANYLNPFQQGINISSTVLQYNDVGGQYANVRFDVDTNFDMFNFNRFSLKIYISSSGLTGAQTNQVSLKLQDGQLGAPWSTQCEIIKPLVLDQWQIVTFDFLNDSYINLDPGSLAPTQRTDFNRVVIQVNGENNNDLVLAYIDDFTNNDTNTTPTSQDPEYTLLVWSDEFSGSGAINSSKWHHQIQLPFGGSWYNGEIQHYTNRQENTSLNNGYLHLVGKKETFTDQGVTKDYTSARLNSKFAFTYGKVEVRAKLPTGTGTWPAIWMLGKNINEDGAYWDEQGYGTTQWPACGEIDIMEHWGVNQNYVQSATHTPSCHASTVKLGGQVIPTASDSFHIYTMKWYPNKLVFDVDGVTHYTYKPSILNADTWPFNADQYLILNLAFLSYIDPSYTQDTLVVDYVRIYQHDSLTHVHSYPQTEYALNAYPNPAKDLVHITYTLAEPTVVNLCMYDLHGRLLHTLVNQYEFAGQKKVQLDAKGLNSGMYFYRLQTRYGMQTKQIVIQ